ncbi:MFS transporter [Micromonospora sp. NEAU-HG-1]|nr:MFS transporter [Micromonospora rubida]
MVVLAPSMARVARDFHTTVGVVSQARTATAVSAIAASVALFPLIARWNLRHLTWLGAAVAVASGVATATAVSMPMFIGAHLLAGVAVALLLSCSFAGAALGAGRQAARALGLVAGANSLGWVFFNPLAGLLTQSVSWRLAFLLPVASACGAALAALRIPPTAPAPRAAATTALPALLTITPVRRWISAEVLSYCAWTIVLTFVGPVLALAGHLSEGMVGLVLGCGSAGFFLASSQSGRLTGVARPRLLIAASSLAIGVLSAVLFGSAGPVWLSVLLFFLVAVAAGVRTPAASLLGASLSPEHVRAVMASRTVVTQVGYLFGAAGGGLVLSVGGFTGLGALSLVGMVSAGLLHWRHASA